MKQVYLVSLVFLVMACNLSNAATPKAVPIATPIDHMVDKSPSIQQVVPHEARWGIYRLVLDTQGIDLLYSSPIEIAGLRLNSAGDRLVFSQKVGQEGQVSEEIFTLAPVSSDLRRVTNNGFWDLYPVWSPDGSRIAFLSQRASSLGIYVMNADGSGEKELFDSNSHEADVDWIGNQIVFTKDSSIWIMESDGTGIRQITHPPRAGEWGNANLPFGDYDPRISPDGARVVFERLMDDQSPHGNYDFHVVEIEGAKESRLTQTGYSQGLASWSNSGTQIVYVVAAIGATGQYDLYMMNVDGIENRNITPPYFPPEFLCHWAVFSSDDTAIYFIGEWWVSE